MKRKVEIRKLLSAALLLLFSVHLVPRELWHHHEQAHHEENHQLQGEQMLADDDCAVCDFMFFQNFLSESEQELHNPEFQIPQKSSYLLRNGFSPLPLIVNRGPPSSAA